MNQPLVWDAEQLSPDDASHYLTNQELILTIPLVFCVPAGNRSPLAFFFICKNEGNSNLVCLM